MAIDYIYGSLDESVVPVFYNGSETSTAITTVDNDKRVIKVDVKNSSSYEGGEGIVVSDNTISIDDEVVATKEDVANVRTYKTFNSGWNLSGTTQEFCQSVEEDILAPEGTAYLGTLNCKDLPNDMVQAEAIVEIISSGANGKCIDITLTSLEVSPYRWTYSYGRVNGSVVTVGWKGSQEELVSGTNIKTINGSSILGSGDLTISGGTTLNYYTYSLGTSLIGKTSKIINILKNAKGRILGYLRFRVSETPIVDMIVHFNNAEYYNDSYANNIRFRGVHYTQSALYLYDIYLINGVNEGIFSNSCLKIENNTITSALNLGMQLGGYIAYFNDTQLH